MMAVRKSKGSKQRATQGADRPAPVKKETSKKGVWNYIKKNPLADNQSKKSL